MKVFIVYAHPEPQSFNGALKDIAINYFHEMNHEVFISDLYEMKFNPIASRDDFKRVSNAEYFKYSQEQNTAAINNSFADDIIKEQQKLLGCDLLIIQFPLWWYGFPAILKGWLDRVLTKGSLYNDALIYDKGFFKGKRAFFSLTTGGTPNPTVSNADIENIISYFNHGILYFLGFEVLKPFIAYSPARMTLDERSKKLIEYKKFLEDLDNEPEIQFSPLKDLDHRYSLNCSS